MTFKKRTRFNFFIIFNLIIISIIYSLYASYNKKVLEPINQKNFKNLDFTNYYYNQLNDYEKEIYENLIKSQEKFLNGETVILNVNFYNKQCYLSLDNYANSAKKAIKACIYDNPKVDIWLDGYKRSLKRSEDNIYLIFECKEENKDNFDLKPENIYKSLSDFDLISNNFVSNLSGTDTKKLTQIHDWLVENACYDYTISLPNTRTAYGAIVQKRSVCSGFAYAYKYLASLAGIDVLYVVGEFYNSQDDTFTPHAWNVVCIKNKFYIVDVTFDCTLNSKTKNTFLFSPIDDGMHFASTDYFNYDF